VKHHITTATATAAAAAPTNHRRRRRHHRHRHHHVSPTARAHARIMQVTKFMRALKKERRKAEDENKGRYALK
jgi:hypothetical protein